MNLLLKNGKNQLSNNKLKKKSWKNYQKYADKIVN